MDHGDDPGSGAIGRVAPGCGVWLNPRLPGKAATRSTRAYMSAAPRVGRKCADERYSSKNMRIRADPAPTNDEGVEGFENCRTPGRWRKTVDGGRAIRVIPRVVALLTRPGGQGDHAVLSAGTSRGMSETKCSTCVRERGPLATPRFWSKLAKAAGRLRDRDGSTGARERPETHLRPGSLQANPRIRTHQGQRFPQLAGADGTPSAQ